MVYEWPVACVIQVVLLARDQVVQSPNHNRSKATRPDAVHVNITFSHVYFGELFVSVQDGVSRWQYELHQSQLFVSP